MSESTDLRNTIDQANILGNRLDGLNVDCLCRSIICTDYCYFLTRVVGRFLLIVEQVDFFVPCAIEHKLDLALHTPDGAIFCGLESFFLHHCAMSSVRSALVVHDFAREGHRCIVLLLPDSSDRNETQ